MKLFKVFAAVHFSLAAVSFLFCLVLLTDRGWLFLVPGLLALCAGFILRRAVRYEQTLQTALN